MTPGLKVLSPGLHTTVQDLGRIGYQDIGVPVSGALDGFGLRLANALVGNPQGMAALLQLDRNEPCLVSNACVLAFVAVAACCCWWCSAC